MKKDEFIHEVLADSKNIRKIGEYIKLWDKQPEKFSFFNPLIGNLIHYIAIAPDSWKIYKHIPDLQKRGVDINQKNEIKNEEGKIIFGLTPAFCAVRTKHIQTLKYLHICKADLTILCDNRHILEFATLNKLPPQDYTWIEQLFEKKFPENLFVYYSNLMNKDLYLQKIMKIRDKISDVDFKPEPYKCSALQEASGRGNLAAVKYLLEQKADPLLVGHQGYNSIMFAIIANHIPIVKFFLEKDDRVINSKILNGGGVLYVAACLNRTKMINLLLENKSDINAENCQRLTPLAIAMEKNHVEVSQLLLKQPDLKISQRVFSNCLESVFNNKNLELLAELLKLLEIYPTYISDVHSKLFFLLERGELGKFEIQAIKDIYSSIDLNEQIRYGNFPFDELISNFLGAKVAIDLIKWFLNTLKDKLESKAILSAFKTALKENNIRICGLLKIHLLPRLPEFDQLIVTFEAYKASNFNIMILYMPEIKKLINSPILKGSRFEIKEIFFMKSYLMMRTVQEDIVTYCVNFPKNESFLQKLYLTPGLSQCLLKSKKTSTQLSEVLSFSYSEDSPIIRRTISINPFSFLRETKSPEEVKLFMRETKHSQTESTALTVYGPPRKTATSVAPCTWFDGSLSSDDPRLLPIDGGTPNCRILIPSSLREQSGTEKLLNKSRWHFEEENGLKTIKGRLPIQVAIELEEKTFMLDTQFGFEIKSSTKERILCVKLTAADRGVLIIPAFYSKKGLHTRNPSLPKQIKLKIPSAERRLGYGT